MTVVSELRLQALVCLMGGLTAIVTALVGGEDAEHFGVSALMVMFIWLVGMGPFAVRDLRKLESRANAAYRPTPLRGVSRTALVTRSAGPTFGIMGVGILALGLQVTALFAGLLLGTTVLYSLLAARIERLEQQRGQVLHRVAAHKKLRLRGGPIDLSETAWVAEDRAPRRDPKPE